MTRRHVAAGASYLALTVAVVLVILLARRIDGINERHTETIRRVLSARAGVYVPEYATLTLSGDPITLAAAGERQVLFFLTTTCPYCRASLPNWKELAGDAGSGPGSTETGQSIRAIGVIMDSVQLAERYRDEHDLRFPLVVLEDRRYASLFRVRAVPLTMVVDGDAGRVLHARTGELTDPRALDSVRVALTAEFTTPPPGPPAPVSTNGGEVTGGG